MNAKALFVSALSVIFLFLSSVTFAQQTEMSQKEQRKLEKEKKKQEKENEALVLQKVYADMLESKYYVFMANTITSSQLSSWDRGRQFLVTPAYNFLSVIGDTVVFQFAFEGVGYIGPNGIGGFTMKGEILEYEVALGKNLSKPIRVKARLQANARWQKPSFTLTLLSEGFANISFSIRDVTFTMSGQVVKPEDSGVYEGMESLIDR